MRTLERFIAWLFDIRVTDLPEKNKGLRQTFTPDENLQQEIRQQVRSEIQHILKSELKQIVSDIVSEMTDKEFSGQDTGFDDLASTVEQSDVNNPNRAANPINTEAEPVLSLDDTDSLFRCIVRNDISPRGVASRSALLSVVSPQVVPAPPNNLRFR